MIGGNPVVVQQGGGSKVYSITDSLGLGFPASAEAGSLVAGLVGVMVKGDPVITDSKGNVIPYATGTSLARVAQLSFYYFVMPASDVTVTATNA